MWVQGKIRLWLGIWKTIRRENESVSWNCHDRNYYSWVLDSKSHLTEQVRRSNEQTGTIYSGWYFSGTGWTHYMG